MAKTRAVSLSKEEVGRRITRLSKQAVPSFAGAENLDRPIDADIQVTGPAHAHRLTLMLDGVAASWLTVVDYRQRIGPCVVRMGGIAGVGTHEEHRFKGYSRRVMLNSLRWMRRAGYDTSMLYGISGYYPKFGFAPAFPTTNWSMPVKVAERCAGEAGKFRFVDFAAAEHLPAVLKMYHANNATRTGTALRDEATWQPFRKGVSWNKSFIAKVALDAKGRPAGYFAMDGDLDGTVTEMGFATPAVFPAILRATAEAATSVVTFYLPEDDAFMAWCKPLGVRKKLEYRPDGGAMVRLINVRSVLEKIAPLLARRIGGRGRLGVRTNIESVELSWSSGEMHVGPGRRAGKAVALPQWALAQLVYGYQSAETLLALGVLKGGQESLEVLAAMFPPGPHYLHKADEF